jgi:predicted DsbA family dithiol-disulfide isomerase/uncharacterized membrane protein
MNDSLLTDGTTPALSAREERNARLVYVGLVALTTLGLFASAALLVDYIRPLPLFCSESGGCGQLRQSAYAHIGPLKTPMVGVIGYLTLASLTLARGPVARFLHLVAASFGACAGVYYLSLQFKLSTFCVYCMCVDLSSIALLGLVLLRVRLESDGFGRRGSAAVGALFAAALVIPFVPHALIKTPVPEVIAQEMKKTPPGQVTVVDFIDFECPYCRQTWTDFEPVLEKYRGKVRVVRKQVPLVTKHPHALTAARAACCAESMGQGDAMAARLISMPPDDLTEDGCAAAAQSLGLDEPAFRACMSSPTTQAQIDADGAEFKAAHGHALPTLWIGSQKIEGAEGPEALQKAMEKALEEVGG